MKFLKIKIEPGEEVMSVLEKQIKENKWKKGTMTIIGAVDECCISNMPKNDAKKDITHEYKQPMEISGVGEIRDGKPHIHMTLSMEGDKTIHGHLNWANVVNWYVVVYLTLE